MHTGLNSLKGFNVTDFQILLDKQPDGANTNGTVYIPNPTVMTLEMVQTHILFPPLSFSQRKKNSSNNPFLRDIQYRATSPSPSPLPGPPSANPACRTSSSGPATTTSPCARPSTSPSSSTWSAARTRPTRTAPCRSRSRAPRACITGGSCRISRRRWRRIG